MSSGLRGLHGGWLGWWHVAAAAYVLAICGSIASAQDSSVMQELDLREQQLLRDLEALQRRQADQSSDQRDAERRDDRQREDMRRETLRREDLKRDADQEAERRRQIGEGERRDRERERQR